MAARQQPGIVTPEAVLLEFETAGVGSRSIARAIDSAAQLAGLFAVTLALTSLFSFGSVPAWLAIVFVVIGIFLVIFGYSIAFETLWAGRTPGKAALGLRVVTAEGAPVRFRHAALRAIFVIPDFLLVGPAVSIISSILTRRTQRLGDLVAGTIVLRERTGASAPMAVTFRVFPGWEEYARSLDVGSLTAEEYGLIRSFLMRVAQLQPGARGQLAMRLGSAVAEKMHHTIPAGVHPEHFLVTVAAAYQHRFESMGPIVVPQAAPPPPAAPTYAAAPPVAAEEPPSPAPEPVYGTTSDLAPPSFAPIEEPTSGGFAPPE